MAARAKQGNARSRIIVRSIVEPPHRLGACYWWMDAKRPVRGCAKAICYFLLRSLANFGQGVGSNAKGGKSKSPPPMLERLPLHPSEERGAGLSGRTN